MIRLLPDGQGLISTVDGETLVFSTADTNIAAESIRPDQKVHCTARSLAPDSAELYGRAENVVIDEFLPLTDELADRVFTALHKKYAESSIEISDAAECLAENEIHPDEYGFVGGTELFLEQFSDRIHIDYDNDTLRTTTMQGCRELYENAVSHLARQHYPCMTLLQKRVFSDEGFWNSKRLLIMGSTSSGKTAIPITKYLSERERLGKRLKMVIAVPLRALATQMKQSLENKLADYDLDIAVSTSEYVDRDTDIRHGNVDIAIVIYEKLFVFTADTDRFFNNYDYVVFDEINIFQNIERGAKSEVMNLKLLASRNNVIMLATPYHDWSRYIEKYDMYPIKMYSRPTKIFEHFVFPEKTGMQMYNSAGEPVSFNGCNKLSTLCCNEIKRGHKTVVFTFSQANTRKWTKDIYNKYKKQMNIARPSADEISAFRSRFLRHYNVSREELKGIYDEDAEFEALMNGIGFHNASLPEAMRTALEKELLDEPEMIPGGLRLVVATDTIAYGLNSNVDTVIMQEMSKNTGRENVTLSYHEYQNCIGRAGRFGYRNSGNSYAFIDNYSFNDIKEEHPVDTKEFMIDHYSSNIRRNTTPQSTLCNMIKDTDHNKFTFYMHSLLPGDSSGFTHTEIKQLLSRLPNYSQHDENQGKLDTLIADALEFLLGEQMIAKRSPGYDDFMMDDTDDEQRYYVTHSGRDFQSVAISRNGYFKLEKALSKLGGQQPFRYIDFFYELCSIEDIISHFHIDKDMEKEKAKARFTVDLADKYLRDALDLGIISEELYNSITDSEELDKAYNGDLLSDTEINALTLIRLSIISAMWLTGYSLDLINQIAGSDNAGIDSIRRKIGEKSSHIIDAVYAKAVATERPQEICTQLKRMSIGMFYGIDIGYLDALGADELNSMTPQRANDLHIASIYARRYEYLLDEEEATFRNEIAELSEKVRNILKQEGIDQ